MQTRVGRGKIQLAAFDGPFPKTFPQMQKKSRRNLLHKPSYSNCPKLRCHGNGAQWGQPGVNINVTINYADPENFILEPKIATILHTTEVMTV